jgi:hypothetical protein
MHLSPEEFITKVKEGKSIEELNQKELCGVYNDVVLKQLIIYGHTLESAREHLDTDYSNGYTICNKCGSYYHLGDGFTKHLSNGCMHCEGEAKHRVYFNEGPEDSVFPPRYMSVMFDDGMHYCKNKLEIEKYKDLVSEVI